MAKKNLLTQSKKAKADRLVHAGQLETARDIYADVCKKDRLDVEAWAKLSDVSRRLGDFAAAENSARHAIAISPKLALPHQFLGSALQCQGRIDEAIDAYRQALALNSNYPDGHYLLGNALIEKGLMAEGAECCLHALALRPDFFEALGDLGAALLFLGRREEAAAALARAHSLRPNAPEVLANLASLKELEGHAEEALSDYAHVLQINPASVDILAKQADLLEKTGHLAQAREQVAHGLTLKPTHALLQLVSARLARRESRFEEAAAILEELLAKPLPHDLAGEASLLLGQLYDRLGQHAKVFPLLVEGKQHIARATHADEGTTRRMLERIQAARQWLGSPFPVKVSDEEARHPSPAFLIGFPRSGTTLLEQILDSHPAIRALEEKPMSNVLEQAFLELTGGGAGSLARLDEAQLDKLRKIYFDEVANHTRHGTEYTLLVDKLPLNTIRVPLLWRVFPNARFILAIRHPCDVCLSCLMQNFAANEAMKSFISLDAIASIYTAVMEAWQDYARQLPLRFHRIRYEDLITQQEHEVRQLLQFLDLPWNDAVLAHTQHAQERSIKTPSYHQVTQPIYQHAKLRWKNYQQEFAPVMDKLIPAIRSFGYET